jgi:hypothetical protein
MTIVFLVKKSTLSAAQTSLESNWTVFTLIRRCFDTISPAMRIPLYDSFPPRWMFFSEGPIYITRKINLHNLLVRIVSPTHLHYCWFATFVIHNESGKPENLWTPVLMIGNPFLAKEEMLGCPGNFWFPSDWLWSVMTGPEGGSGSDDCHWQLERHLATNVRILIWKCQFPSSAIRQVFAFRSLFDSPSPLPNLFHSYSFSCQTMNQQVESLGLSECKARLFIMRTEFDSCLGNEVCLNWGWAFPFGDCELANDGWKCTMTSPGKDRDDRLKEDSSSVRKCKPSDQISVSRTTERARHDREYWDLIPIRTWIPHKSKKYKTKPEVLTTKLKNRENLGDCFVTHCDSADTIFLTHPFRIPERHYRGTLRDIE